MYPNLKLFNLNIPMNYVMIFIGFLAMLIFNICIRKSYKYSLLKAIFTSIIVNIYAIVGAILLFKIENIGKNTSLGLSFFGTVFFLPLFMFLTNILLKKHQISSDYWSLSVPLELAFVRFGCFLCGCCGGIFTKYGIQFPNDPIGHLRFPIQIIEVFFDLLIFILLLLLHDKKKNSKICYAVFMVSYSFIRFILEIFRDTPKYLLNFSNGQLFAIISFIIGIILFMRNYTKND